MVDEKLSNTVDCFESKGGILNYLLLNIKVLANAKTQNMSEFKASTGWLQNRKKQINIGSDNYMLNHLYKRQKIPRI